MAITLVILALTLYILTFRINTQVIRGHFKNTLQLLFNNGANINQISDFPLKLSDDKSEIIVTTPLSIIIFHKKHELIPLLLQSGADPSAPQPDETLYPVNICYQTLNSDALEILFKNHPAPETISTVIHNTDDQPLALLHLIACALTAKIYTDVTSQLPDLGNINSYINHAESILNLLKRTNTDLLMNGTEKIFFMRYLNDKYFLNHNPLHLSLEQRHRILTLFSVL